MRSAARAPATWIYLQRQLSVTLKSLESDRPCFHFGFLFSQLGLWGISLLVRGGLSQDLPEKPIGAIAWHREMRYMLAAAIVIIAGIIHHPMFLDPFQEEKKRPAILVGTAPSLSSVSSAGD